MAVSESGALANYYGRDYEGARVALWTATGINCGSRRGQLYKICLYRAPDSISDKTDQRQLRREGPFRQTDQSRRQAATDVKLDASVSRFDHHLISPHKYVRGTEGRRRICILRSEESPDEQFVSL
ncbi:hypothetical protein LSAT2_004566 [Lamellibrachia satsuma]|nr:hypothetical protein LSAT2_004566 [Lamellibrachia satsuma]